MAPKKDSKKDSKKETVDKNGMPLWGNMRFPVAKWSHRTMGSHDVLFAKCHTRYRAKAAQFRRLQKKDEDTTQVVQELSLIHI
jgi:hypothetical protein